MKTAPVFKRVSRRCGRLGAVAAAALLFAGSPGVAEEPGAPAAILDSLIAFLERHGIQPHPEALNDALIEAVVRSADSGGRVLTPEDRARLRDRRRGVHRSAGIGIEWRHPDGWIVATVVEGSSAEQAGVVPGTVLDSVDGTYVSGRTAAEVLRWLDEGENDTVQLDVRLPGESGVVGLEFSRAAWALPSIAAVESWPRNLAYVKVRGLYDDAAPTVAACMRDWQEADKAGVILDLRGAGGNRVDAAAALAGLLAERPEDESLVIESLDGTAIEEFMAVAGERIHLPTLVLIDGQTEGAAELLAAVLRAVGRGAMLIGSPTSGDCGLREALAFNDRVFLYLRTRRVLLSGEDVCVPGADGIEPHVLVGPGAGPDAGLLSEEAVRKKRGPEAGEDERALRDRIGKDRVLQRAADILLGLQALENGDGHAAEE